MALLRLRKTYVASSYTLRACQAGFLPFPTNAETISQPVKAWKKGSGLNEDQRIRRCHGLAAIESCPLFQKPAIRHKYSDQQYAATTRTTTSVSELEQQHQYQN